MFTRILACMKGIARRNKIDAEVDDELRFHIEISTQANIARGMTPEEARRVALRDLGGVRQTKEAVREVRGLPWLEDLGRDIRYALRLASRQPRFSLMIVSTTALAVGLSTALFSVVDATLLRPLPYQHAEELMDGQVGFEIQEPHRLFYGVAISDIRRWRGSNAIAGAAGWRYGADVVLAGAVPVRATARDITEGYFRVYGVTVSPGRDFTTADTARGAAPVVIVSRKMVLPAASTPSIATRTGCGRLTAAVRVAMSLTISSRRVGVRMVEVV